MNLSIGNRLKEETKYLHDLAEEKMQSRKIMDKSFTVSEYYQFLKRNYIFLNQFENAVFSALSEENLQKLNAEKRRKLSFIRKDLDELMNVAEEDPISINIKNEAEAFGILYVMEGATLGGNVIAKNLAKNPAFSEITFHYFGCYGDETGILWKNFKAVLEDFADETNEEDILQGAKRAYQFLLDLP